MHWALIRGLMQYHAVAGCGCLHVNPGQIAFFVAHALYLVKPCDGIAYVARIFQRFLALGRKCKLACGHGISFLCRQLGHLQFPCLNARMAQIVE